MSDSKKKIIQCIITIFFLLLVAHPIATHAQAKNPANTAQSSCTTHSASEKYASVCTDLGQFYNIGSYIGAVIDSYVTPLAVIAALVMITFAGFQYIYSGGSPEAIKLSKELIIGAVLGLVLIFMAGFIIDKLIDADELNININDTPNSWVQPSQRPNPGDLFS